MSIFGKMRIKLFAFTSESFWSGRVAKIFDSKTDPIILSILKMKILMVMVLLLLMLK